MVKTIFWAAAALIASGCAGGSEKQCMAPCNVTADCNDTGYRYIRCLNQGVMGWDDLDYGKVSSVKSPLSGAP